VSQLCADLARLTPAITTSYFSSGPLGSNFGLKRGTGGANEGRTRRSREEVEYSVKTGIWLVVFERKLRMRMRILSG
jgi:hypothetical protein